MMHTNVNEDLFQEILKLQRRVRQTTPPPRDDLPRPPSRDGRRFQGHPHPPFRERILRSLLEAEKGFRQKQLCEIIGVGAPAMSETVERLEAEGYIRRIPDPDDGRATRILLTDLGRARAYETRDDHEKHMSEMFKKLNEDEKILLTTLLKKINH